MQLSELLKDIATIAPEMDCTITGICADSRILQPGEVFIAYTGTNFIGHEFIPQALTRGASAVLCEDTQPLALLSPHRQQIPIIPVPQLTEIIGILAARFYDEPAKKLKIIGITGTNGKTSCSHFIARSLSAAGIKCGMIGTLGIGFPGELQNAGLTTPDAITIQRELANFVAQGAKAVAMEVSSHSLMQHRVVGIDFTVAVFTNLTRDHLDYHGTMENYARAKQKLFLSPNLQYAVLNLDDACGQQFLAELPVSVTGYGYTVLGATSTKPVISAEDVVLSPNGINATVHTPWGNGELHSPLLGRFNLSNLLATLTVLNLLEIPMSAALSYLENLTTVPGRMQMLGGKGRPIAVVDYSHTPDALQQALTALREHCSGTLWCVFGCGGERDRGKRPLMAQIAERFSDHVIVTNDNPRREVPEAIIAEIMNGFEQPDNVQSITDRRAAITAAISQATPKDIILIAGKGHEDYQIIGTEKAHFSDVEEAEICLRRYVYSMSS